ncbi:hypothetical protein [Kangiella sediminilitoris]|uniref:Outer membrane protein beta-barrel domain-containing protein n=1 Tax=Kangiella sediminilitoris TaxID=1144748 RepID=A0A1B3B955_9GAMM|nr:hypothetical protein [Kangiella sediminilitoris]AOE49323.1 hypothetical protein KS2013_599 [Kangiella sediminilitoris]
MNKLLTTTAMALGLVLAGVSAKASDKINYEFIEMGFLHSEGELTSDKSGYQFNISQAFNETWYTRAAVRSQSADVYVTGLTTSVTSKDYTIAVGFHLPSSRTDDFYTEIGYLKFDGSDIVSASTYGNDEEGFMVETGFRGRLSPDWEYKIYAGYKDYDYSKYVDEDLHEDSNSTFYGIESRYYLSKQWSLGVTLSEEITGLTSGLNFRYNL